MADETDDDVEAYKKNLDRTSATNFLMRPVKSINVKEHPDTYLPTYFSSMTTKAFGDNKDTNTK